MTPPGPALPELPLPVCSMCLEAILQDDPIVTSQHSPPAPPVHVRCWPLPTDPPLAPLPPLDAIGGRPGRR
jgi:hypothetical protein